MKFSYKRTMLIGLAFMSICSFWQLYDNLIPIILRDTFGMKDGISGIIMASDNVLALFLLPLLGTLSDKVHTKIGKRMPFILLGTAIAVIAMMFIPIINNAYNPGKTEYLLYVFIGVLLILLLAMASYRSPAVALMPDLTIKPMRSKANAVINLMGAIGGILYLIISALILKESDNGYDYFPIFAIVSGIMIVSVLVLFFTIKENRMASEVTDYENKHPEENLLDTTTSSKASLPKPVKRSLVFILASISLWFIGYNAVTTAFSKYATQEWEMTLSSANLCLTVATVGAIISYIPIGILSSRFGRKKTIIAGVILLAASFGTAAIYTMTGNKFSPALYVLFVLIGIAWAAINVNSLPMVVEMCYGSDIGKFTGLYYTFSMSAQIVTPILSGFLLEHLGYWTLFPYSTLFVILSGVTMLFVHHGDNKPTARKGLEAFDVED